MEGVEEKCEIAVGLLVHWVVVLLFHCFGEEEEELNC